MASKNEHLQRSGCPIALSLDILGDHWTLLIVRDLLFGKHEFKDFLTSPEAISSNILSNRLSRLLSQDMVRWIPHPDDKKRKLYYLTEKGKGLIHVIIPLVSWSLQYCPGQTPIPEAGLKRLRQSPGQFVSSTLGQLEKWEADHGIQATAIQSC